MGSRLCTVIASQVNDILTAVTLACVFGRVKILGWITVCVCVCENVRHFGNGGRGGGGSTGRGGGLALAPREPAEKR